jgi:hypothetical protein
MNVDTFLDIAPCSPATVLLVHTNCTNLKDITSANAMIGLMVSLSKNYTSQFIQIFMLNSRWDSVFGCSKLF